jgi:hypothetical protein
MQQILNVITPAASYDLVTLAEMKASLLIPPTDTSKDVLLTDLITSISETVATMCNRVFGADTVDETFYQLEDGTSQRLYLSRWPVKLADISSLTMDGSDLMINSNVLWVLEEDTGTLYSYPTTGPWYGVIDAKYTGGYVLPTDAPGPLKFAVKALVKESYSGWIRNPALFGIRQVGHKESRIGYYQPNLLGVMGTPETWQNVKNVLNKYIRYWV